MKKKLGKVINDVKRKGFWFALKWLFWGAQLKWHSLFNYELVHSKYGIKLRPNYADATFRLYVFGGYGFFYSDYLNMIPHEFVFVDIGANQGLYSIVSAKNINCKNVFGFEPVDHTFSLLNDNILLNKVDEKTQTYKKAVDSISGVKSINFDKNHSGNASLFLASDTNTPLTRIETINKDFLNEIFIEVEEKIYLKVDVEGYEFTVLSEILKMQKAHLIRSIFYEIDTRWVNPDKIENLLKSYGFNEFKKIGNSLVHFDILATKN